MRTLRHALVGPVCAGVLVSLLAASCGGGPERSQGAGPTTLLVSAAVSLTEVLESIARQYEAASRVQIRLNTGPSNALARQIVEGAAVDVFISADETQMDLVERADRLEPRTRVDLVSNRLVLVVPRRAAVSVSEPADLLSPQVRRVALGDPQGVPVGVYARRYLESIELWTPLQSRLVPMSSARAVLSAVAGGDADAGFVYRTDVALAAVETVFTVPPDPSLPIIYPAAIVKGSRHRDAAARFLAYLQEPDARRVFEAAGFIWVQRE